MNRGAWWATVQGASKNQRQLSEQFNKSNFKIRDEVHIINPCE